MDDQTKKVKVRTRNMAGNIPFPEKQETWQEILYLSKERKISYYLQMESKNSKLIEKT